MGGVRALGTHCTPKAIYLAIVEESKVVDAEPQRIEVPDGLRSGASLKELSEDVRRRLGEAKATHAVLLEPTSYEGGPKAIMARVAAETMLRTTGAALGLDIELLNRATARARLGISKSGSLDSKISELFPSPVGKYWAEGRRYAAFAALACTRGVA